MTRPSRLAIKSSACVGDSEREMGDFAPRHVNPSFCLRQRKCTPVFVNDAINNNNNDIDTWDVEGNNACTAVPSFEEQLRSIVSFAADEELRRTNKMCVDKNTASSSRCSWSIKGSDGNTINDNSKYLIDQEDAIFNRIVSNILKHATNNSTIPPKGTPETSPIAKGHKHNIHALIRGGHSRVRLHDDIKRLRVKRGGNDIKGCMKSTAKRTSHNTGATSITSSDDSRSIRGGYGGIRSSKSNDINIDNILHITSYASTASTMRLDSNNARNCPHRVLQASSQPAFILSNSNVKSVPLRDTPSPLPMHQMRAAVKAVYLCCNSRYCNLCGVSNNTMTAKVSQNAPLLHHGVRGTSTDKEQEGHVEKDQLCFDEIIHMSSVTDNPESLPPRAIIAGLISDCWLPFLTSDVHEVDENDSYDNSAKDENRKTMQIELDRLVRYGGSGYSSIYEGEDNVLSKQWLLRKGLDIRNNERMNARAILSNASINVIGLSTPSFIYSLSHCTRFVNTMFPSKPLGRGGVSDDGNEVDIVDLWFASPEDDILFRHTSELTEDDIIQFEGHFSLISYYEAILYSLLVHGIRASEGDNNPNNITTNNFTEKSTEIYKRNFTPSPSSSSSSDLGGVKTMLQALLIGIGVTCYQNGGREQTRRILEIVMMWRRRLLRVLVTVGSGKDGGGTDALQHVASPEFLFSYGGSTKIEREIMQLPTPTTSRLFQFLRDMLVDVSNLLWSYRFTFSHQQQHYGMMTVLPSLWTTWCYESITDTLYTILRTGLMYGCLCNHTNNTADNERGMSGRDNARKQIGNTDMQLNGSDIGDEIRVPLTLDSEKETCGECGALSTIESLMLRHCSPECSWAPVMFGNVIVRFLASRCLRHLMSLPSPIYEEGRICNAVCSERQDAISSSIVDCGLKADMDHTKLMINEHTCPCIPPHWQKVLRECLSA